jgi:pimeloyl-ACP methyl ester carboxylesterase
MAVIAAARFPTLCRAVITESAQAFVEPRTLHSIAKAKVRFAAAEELAKLERYHGNKARWIVDAWTDTWLTAEFRDWSLLADLARVTCPLLAIHGDQDEYGSMAFPEALSSMTAGSAEKLILRECGHVPHREQEFSVLDAVAEFLGRVIAPENTG